VLDFRVAEVFEELAVPVRSVLRNSVRRLAGTAWPETLQTNLPPLTSRTSGATGVWPRWWRRWLDGYLKTSELARRLPACEVFSISDREGDIFEVFEAWHQAAGGPRAEWIIRANQDRALLGMVEGDPSRLFEALAAAPVLGNIEFGMSARKGTKKVKGNRVATFRSARTVRQVVRAMKITPRPPERKGGKLEEVSFWAILPCGCVFEEAEWKGACAVVKRDKNAPEPSIAEFMGIVGKLGGHPGRKSDGPPGPQSIWQGLTRVRDFALAWKAYYGE